MLWIKVALACLAIAFSVGIGYLAANKYRCRRDFFSQLSDFNERYINELEYARKPLPVFLKETSATGDFKKMLEEFSSSRAPQLKFSYLTKEEKRSVQSISPCLDVEMRCRKRDIFVRAGSRSGR